MTETCTAFLRKILSCKPTCWSLSLGEPLMKRFFKDLVTCSTGAILGLDATTDITSGLLQGFEPMTNG